MIARSYPSFVDFNDVNLCRIMLFELPPVVDLIAYGLYEKPRTAAGASSAYIKTPQGETKGDLMIPMRAVLIRWLKNMRFKIA